jgi:predicted phosphoribosyltransferase
MASTVNSPAEGSGAATTSSRFPDRADAGRFLAERLSGYAGRDDVIVLALPRGGVPVGAEVAKALGVPLDVFVVRKLGVPGREELAMGAIASGGLIVLDQGLVRALGVSADAIRGKVGAELRELERREAAYRDGREPLQLEGKTVILVDDGLATGATMRAAALAVREARPARIVLAVPVAGAERCEELRDVVDEVVCGLTPRPLGAVGRWYEDFSQTSDEDVRELLAAAAKDPGGRDGGR